MPKIKTILTITILASILLPATAAFAADTYKACEDNTCSNERTVCYEGMIPCGKNMMCSSDPSPITNGRCDPTKGPVVINNGNKPGCNLSGGLVTIDCQLCHFFILGKGVLAFVVKIVLIVSALLIVVGGFMYMVCSGDSGCISRANAIFKSVAIGITVIFIAWVVVGTVFVQLGVQPWTGLVSWHQIKCPIVTECCF